MTRFLSVGSASPAAAPTILFIAVSGLFVFLLGCTSQPVKSDPEWIHGATRTYDNGYIVYIGQSSASSAEIASFRAEGVALEDLANECSVVPKGTRVEDRYQRQEPSGSVSSNGNTPPTIAFVRIAVEYKDCQEASKAVEPSEIKKLASVPFTEQLKRYQDFTETGLLASGKTDDAFHEIAPPEEYAPAPIRGETNETTHFYVTRQYIAYQKQIVVLSSPSAYQPASPESRKFVTALTPAQTQVTDLIQKNASLQTQPQPWSHLKGRPPVARPPALVKASNTKVNEMNSAPSHGQASPQTFSKKSAAGRTTFRRAKKSDSGGLRGYRKKKVRPF